MAKSLFFKNSLNTPKKLNLPVHLKNKFIRTLKVGAFYRTKLRARQLNILFSASYFLDILKNNENKKRNKFIVVNTKKYSQIELNFKNNIKIPHTAHIRFGNDELDMFAKFQSFLIVNKSCEKAFLVNTVDKLINIINLKKIAVVVLHLTDKGIMENIQFPSYNFQKTLSKAYLNNAKIKTQVQLISSFKNNKVIVKTLYLQHIKSKITKTLSKVVKHFNISNLRYSLNRRQKLFKRYKRTKKYSKGWFKFEANKIKRYGSKYIWRYLRRKPSVFGIFQFRKNVFAQHVYLKFENQLLGARKEIILMLERKKRLKELLAKLETSSSKKVNTKKRMLKKTGTYLFMKHRERLSLITKTRVFKYTIYPVSKKYIFNLRDHSILRRNNIVNEILMFENLVFNSKISQMTRNHKKIRDAKFHKFLKLPGKYNKFSKINALAKINLIHRAAFKNVNKRMWRIHKIRDINIKNLLSKTAKQIAYKLKWYNYFEFKSFRWKFYKKRWYFTMSRWKRLVEFRRMLRKAWRSYRKLQKNFLFIKLLRANFKYILGMQESDLLKNWLKVRRGTKHDINISTVDYFNQSLQLKMDGLAMFLGLAPNRLMAQELIHFGGIRVNGMVVTNKNYSINLNDMVQIDLKVNQEIQSLYKSAHWSLVRARLKFTQFLQVQWSLMLFMMVRWPKNYELLNESMLNQRWVRFFIRYFPVRISKYKKAKVKWYKY